MTQEGIIMVINYSGTANIAKRHIKEVAYYYNTNT